MAKRKTKTWRPVIKFFAVAAVVEIVIVALYLGFATATLSSTIIAANLALIPAFLLACVLHSIDPKNENDEGSIL